MYKNIHQFSNSKNDHHEWFDIQCLRNSPFLTIRERIDVYSLLFCRKRSTYLSLCDLDLSSNKTFYKLCNEIFKESFKDDFIYNMINVPVNNVRNMRLFLNNLSLYKEKQICKTIDFSFKIDIGKYSFALHCLGNFIKKNTNLNRLSLSCLKLNDDHIEILSNYFIYNTNIKSIDFSSNPKITNNSLKYLKNIVDLSGVENIIVTGTSIKNENDNLNFLFDSFFKNKNNELISYGYYNLNDDNIKYISKYVNTYYFDKIVIIDFCTNKITSNGIKILFEELILNEENQLEDIILSNNNLDDDCMETLGRLIQEKKSIKHISLSKNFITNKGIRILSDYIIGDVTIYSLDIEKNKDITDESFDNLKEMIEKSSIRDIKLYYTSISRENILLLRDLGQIPIEKREIPLITIGNVKSASKNQ